VPCRRMFHSSFFRHSVVFDLSQCSRFVLEQILSGEATETVVENIHEYLSTVGTNVREGKAKLDEFIVFKVRTYSYSFRRNLSASHLAIGQESRRLS
jgi:hypothetical protein